MTENLIAESSITIEAPADAVWQALTDPALVEKYYFGTKVHSDWMPGSPITWEGVYDGTEYSDHGTILEAVPGQRLAHTHFSPLSGRQDVPENYHTLTWTLEPTDGNTLVTLTQDNNESYDAVKHSEQNWASVLEGLKSVVEA
jgi:uncharacterized protein YndB with AHSA1/START domain